VRDILRETIQSIEPAYQFVRDFLDTFGEVFSGPGRAVAGEVFFRNFMPDRKDSGFALNLAGDRSFEPAFLARFRRAFASLWCGVRRARWCASPALTEPRIRIANAPLQKDLWKLPQTKSQTNSIFSLRSVCDGSGKVIVSQKLKWRATADEDGQYCFAVAL
jgi:hypothetical protein